MRRQWISGTALSLLFIGTAIPAMAFDRGHAEIFAVLPPGSTGSEGLTVGPDGDVYITTFGFNQRTHGAARGQYRQSTKPARFLPRSAISTASIRTVSRWRLLFPASPAFSLDGRSLYVTNLALDLRQAVSADVQAIDSQWTDLVTSYTVSKLSTKFKPLAQGH